MERWEEEANQAINSCTILTTEANEVLRPVHDRMPVILASDDYELWLDSDVRKFDLVKELLRPYPASEMMSYPVGTSINSPRNQGAELIEQVTINSA
jgi:putative SOS response-associated peptidase YedK